MASLHLHFFVIIVITTMVPTVMTHVITEQVYQPINREVVDLTLDIKPLATAKAALVIGLVTIHM